MGVASTAESNSESRANIALQKPYCTKGSPVTGCAAFTGREAQFSKGWIIILYPRRLPAKALRVEAAKRVQDATDHT